MRLAVLTLVSSVLVTSAAVVPAPHLSRRINLLEDVLLFDSPAFQNPANPSETLVQLQSFVSLRQIDMTPLSGLVEAGLSALGIDTQGKITTVLERIKLLGAIGLSGKRVEVSVSGCSSKAVVATSAGPDLGMATRNVSLGDCGASVTKLDASVALGGLDTRDFTAKIFPSGPTGFGVISDIDDTVKVSNVLDKLKLAQSTLIDEPKAVEGMPAFYESLAKSLDSPQFIYVTGSPFQLYPFLRKFIDTAYAASNGPIFLKNLTLTDIPGLIDFLSSDGTLNYKVEMVDRIKGMYPKKTFLAVGDSTQQDPEVYATSFRKYGPSTIACILIREVEGADNSEERFAAAFAGVDKKHIRRFKDTDIPNLRPNLAAGQC